MGLFMRLSGIPFAQCISVVEYRAPDSPGNIENVFGVTFLDFCFDLH